MTHAIGSIKHLTTDTMTLGVSLAARAYGVAKGTASVGVRAVREARQSPPSPWHEATRTEPTPVNVVEELGLDPAPVDTPAAPTPITSIDAQADPDQVDATPADVAERIARADGQE